uniref:Uncharacterized protein n=2 Tax=environmental samples TaxID=651140 RepID=A0A075H5L1_9ARCH|nr:hypothetical protein [uncultured marine thaumarchaeote KM3_182_G12]AIF11656.1 hypothetical protein [uncultured marine thaumarchaeote KM3_53_C08]
MAVCQGSSAWESTRLKTELSRVQVPPLAPVFTNKIKNDNILIEDIILFSDFPMKSKKAKTKSKKTKKRSTKKKAKKSVDSADDSGIILIDDDLEIDAEKELEERKAFLEEARSQDTAD